MCFRGLGLCTLKPFVDGGYGAKRSRGGYEYQEGGRRRSSGFRGRDDGHRRPTDPYDLDYLVSSSQFADYLRRGNRSRAESMGEDELERRYEVYRDNFTRKQNDKFFQKHKDDEWYARIPCPIYIS